MTAHSPTTDASPGFLRNRHTVSLSSKGSRIVSSDDLPKPKKTSGILREFIIRNGLDRSNCLTDEEENARKAQEREDTRKRKRKSVTLTVGAVEAIDVEIVRLESLGVRYPLSRAIIIERAMAALAKRTNGDSSEL